MFVIFFVLAKMYATESEYAERQPKHDALNR